MRFEVCHNLRNQVEDGKLIWCVLSPMWEISNMEKYLYVVHIISSFESRYPQICSCAGCCFNANSFERSMTELFRFTLGLPDSFDVLFRFTRHGCCIFRSLSYWYFKSNCCVFLKLSYLQYPLPNISAQQYLMYIIFSILMCFRYLCFSIPECCAVVALVAVPFLQFFRKYLPFRIFIMKISRLKLLESLWDLNWVVLPIKIQQLGRVWKVLFISD